jgi:peptidoglycan/LPS O-acetylase OafA/YrhL
MVFLFHYGGGLSSGNAVVRALGALTATGWTGVVLFFALSGFLITGSLWDSAGQGHRLRNFYARRALRILPLYYVVILTCTVFSVGRGSALLELQPFAVFALFLQDLPFLANLALANPSPLPLYHLWTLAVEEQFYLIWPVLLLAASNRRSALRLSLWVFAASAAFRFAVYGLPQIAFARQEQLFDSFLLTHAGALALGAALALGLRSTKRARVSSSMRWIDHHARTCFSTGVLLFLISSLLCRSFYLTSPVQFMVGLPGVSLASAASIAIVLRPGVPRHVFAWKPLGWLGRISYGFYIFHILLQPVFDFLGLHLTHSASGALYQTVRMLVAFPLSLLAAWLSFHLLELPFLRRKNRFPLHQPLP